MKIPSGRPRLAAAALAVVAIALGAIAVDRAARHSNDFDNFHFAAVSVWEDGELFLEKGTLRYPPSFQVMMSPFGAFPISVAAALWVLLTYLAFAALPYGFWQLGGPPPARQAWAWFAITPFIVNNITLSQSGPVLLAGATFGILAAARGQAVRGGALIALGGFYKVFPGALLAVPFALRQAPGVLLGAALAGVGIAAWVALAIGAQAGAEDFLRWFEEVRTEQRAERFVEVVRGLRYNNQGLAITLVRSFSTDWSLDPALAAKGSIQLLDIPVVWIWRLYYAVVAVLAVTSAYFAWRTRRAPRTRDFLGLFALATPAMLAVSPLVWTHYFIWLLPCFVYLVETHKRTVITLGVLSLAAVFSVPARALGFHMFMTLALYVLVARQLWRETAAPAEAQ